MRAALALLALLALAGCAAHEDTAAAPTATDAAATASASTTSATTTGPQPPRMQPLDCRTPPESEGRNGSVVIRDAEAFQPWFGSACAWGGDAPPAVDFNASMVVAYFWGEKPSGGYQAVVSGYVPVVEGGSDVGSVRVTRISPGPSCATTAALTYPMAAAIVSPRREQVDVVFKDVVHDCG